MLTDLVWRIFKQMGGSGISVISLQNYDEHKACSDTLEENLSSAVIFKAQPPQDKKKVFLQKMFGSKLHSLIFGVNLLLHQILLISSYSTYLLTEF